MFRLRSSLRPFSAAVASKQSHWPFVLQSTCDSINPKSKPPCSGSSGDLSLPQYCPLRFGFPHPVSAFCGRFLCFDFQEPRAALRYLVRRYILLRSSTACPRRRRGHGPPYLRHIRNSTSDRRTVPC